MNEKIKKIKNSRAFVFFVICMIGLAVFGVSVFFYGVGYSGGWNDRDRLSMIPGIPGDEGQWFAVNHSFFHVYKWEITGNNAWRFFWEVISFENMSGIHVVEFPDDGVMWKVLPFDRVHHPDDNVTVATAR